MTKFDNKFTVPQVPKTFQVLELRDTQQPVKKSNLSVAARSKIINHSGSNYLSERVNDLVPVYGPCTRSDCNHTFWLKLTIGYEGRFGANGYYFKEGENGSCYTAYTMSSIGQARNLLVEFESTDIWVANEVGATSENTRRKNQEAIRVLRSWISVFENGQSVDQTINLGR